MDLSDNETIKQNRKPRKKEYESLCKTCLLEAFTLSFLVNLVIGLLSREIITVL